MTWAEVGRLTDWATQAPQYLLVYKITSNWSNWCPPSLTQWRWRAPKQPCLGQCVYIPCLGAMSLYSFFWGPSHLPPTPTPRTWSLFFLFIFLLNFFNIYLSLWDRDTAWVGEGQREGDTESKAGSRLRADSTEPDVGLELTNPKTMTWAKVRCLTYWATQASLGLAMS